jgi:hypothetical protein
VCFATPFSTGESVLAFLERAEAASSDALRFAVPAFGEQKIHRIKIGLLTFR